MASDEEILAIAVPLVKQFESFRAEPYLDGAGIATIGYGTTRYPNGKRVTMDDAPITEDMALSYAEQVLETNLMIIAKKWLAPATAHQGGGMLSLTYNIGVGAYAGSSVLRLFNAGEIEEAAEAFLMWDKATINGQLVSVIGLMARRKAEMAVFLTADAPAMA